MMDIRAVCNPCRALAHTVPAPALLFFEDLLTEVLPVARLVKLLQVSLGDQTQDPAGWP